MQVAEVFTGTPGKYVDLKDTISAFKGILGVSSGCRREGRLECCP